MIFSDIKNSLAAKIEVAPTTNPLNFFTNYLDSQKPVSKQDPRSSLVGTINETETIIVPAPEENTTNEVSYINESLEIYIFNSDTVAHTVELSVVTDNNDGTPVVYSTIRKFALDPDESLGYIKGKGWMVYNPAGLPKINEIV